MPAKGRRGSLIGCLPIIAKSVALLLIRLLQSLSRQSKMGSSVTHNKALLPTSGRARRYVIYSARTLVGPFPVIESLPAFPYIHSWLS